jgi:hypothetical protein
MVTAWDRAAKVTWCPGGGVGGQQEGAGRLHFLHPRRFFVLRSFAKPIPKYSQNSGLYSAKRNKIAAAAGTGYALSKGRGGGPNQLIDPLGCRFVNAGGCLSTLG